MDHNDLIMFIVLTFAIGVGVGFYFARFVF
jgi:uncharacterized protein YneF (UPF0154 family)